MRDGPRAIEIEQKLNEFLDAYSLYLRTGISLIRDEVRLRAYELCFLELPKPMPESLRILSERL